MTVAILISMLLVIIGLAVMILAILFNCKDWVFGTGILTAIISTVVMVCLIVCDIKQSRPKEYPASEYTFKIKVVEFEEQRDTILVVIPKEK